MYLTISHDLREYLLPLYSRAKVQLFLVLWLNLILQALGKIACPYLHSFSSIMAFQGGCLDVDKLDTTIFNNVCIASHILANETTWSMTIDAFKACGGSSNYFVTADNCYTYCNITTPFDTVMMTNCLADSMAPNFDWTQMEWDCYPFAWDEPSVSETQAGMIATTWPYPSVTWEYTQSNGAVVTQTDNFSGIPATDLTVTFTATANASPKTTGSTATKTTGSKLSSSTSTTATPTSSTKSSGAGKGINFSYGAGALVALSVLAFAL
jgi:hypothetical protein